MLVTVIAPVLTPADLGAKLTLTVQLEAGASVGVHVLVVVKSPVAAIPLILRFAVPVLVRLMTCAELVDAAFCVPKVSVLRSRDTSGTATPVPLKITL